MALTEAERDEYYRERLNDERADQPRKRSESCVCPDMPGRCPGRSNCPLCKPDEDEPDE